MRKNLTFTIFMYMIVVVICAFVIMGVVWTSDTKDVVKESRQLEIDYEKSYKEADLKARVESLVLYLQDEERRLTQSTESILKERVEGGLAQLQHLYDTYQPLLPQSLVKEIAIESIRAQSYQADHGQYIIYDPKGQVLLNDQMGLVMTGEIKDGFYFREIGQGPDHFTALVYVSYFEAYDFYVGSYVNFDIIAQAFKDQTIGYLQEISKNYNGRVSFFLHDYKGEILSDGYYTDRIGHNDYDLENKAGAFPIQEQIKTITGLEDSGFIYQKIYDDTEWLTFVHKIDAWQWVLGGRTDLSDWYSVVNQQDQVVNQQMDDQVKEIVLIMVAVLVVAVLVAFVLTKHLKRGIRSTIKDVKNSVMDLKPVGLEHVAYTDLKEIVQATNLMTHEINHLKHKDPLTGLFNKTHIMEILEAEHLKAIQYQTPLSLILIDIDEFRNINDRYGFEAGDMVLKTVAALIVNMLRDEDMVARYNGEEFLIVLPDTRLETAIEVAERIRQSITSKMIDPIRERVTLSGGVVRGEKDLVRKMIKNVEEALHKAKKKGMNRIHYDG